MTKLALALAAFVSTLPAYASSSPVLSSYLLSQTDPAHLATLGKLFEIEHIKGGEYEVEIPQDQNALLLSLAPNAVLLEKDISASIRAKLQRFALTSAAGYHSFDQVQSWMHTQATANRDLVTVSDYGSSRDGRKLTVLHIAGPHSAGKPVVMITAATHGDELITTEVLMNLVDRLVGAYGKEDRLTKIVDSHDLYFVPVVNPDGFSETNRYDGPADPNRSYPYPQHENAVPTPSIAGVMKLFAGLDV
ncbi:MAG: M14 family metallopeptidase, partial [Bdellovibrionota bacterium]